MTAIDRAALTRWLADHRPSGDCLMQFGVSRLTLERIAAGEVEPEPDIAIRITATLRSSLTHGDGPLAAALNQGGGLFSFEARR